VQAFTSALKENYPFESVNIIGSGWATGRRFSIIKFSTCGPCEPVRHLGYNEV
jgi:hypothetical protein